MTLSLRFRAAIVSVVLFAAFIGIWHLATRSTGPVANMSPGIRQADGAHRHAGQVGDAGSRSMSAQSCGST